MCSCTHFTDGNKNLKKGVEVLSMALKNRMWQPYGQVPSAFTRPLESRPDILTPALGFLSAGGTNFCPEIMADVKVF